MQTRSARADVDATVAIKWGQAKLAGSGEPSAQPVENGRG